MTVAFPAVAFYVRSDAVQIENVDVGFPTNQYLSARLEMDREPASGTLLDTTRRGSPPVSCNIPGARTTVAAEPSVRRIAFADRLPLMYHPHRLIAIDAGGAAPLRPEWPAGYRVSSASVSPDYFDACRCARSVVGVDSDMSDVPATSKSRGALDARGGVVIVNQSFVRLVFGGRNPIGRRIQYVELEEWDAPRPPSASPGPWYEIVGVVRDLGMAVGSDGGTLDTPESDTQAAGGDPKVAGIYHPVAPGGVYPAHMAVHVSGDPAAFAPRLRAIATAIDPTLRLYDMTPLERRD